MTPPPSFDKIGEEYVRQIVDLSPGQRKRYLGQLQVLARTPVRGSLMFAGPVTAIGEAQLKTWLIEWDRSLKTKANYHGLIYGVFAYAVKRGYLAANPAIGTAPKQSRVKQSRPKLVPDRTGVGDRRTAGQETWGRVGRDGRDGIAVR